jgi:hypothetical protein
MEGADILAVADYSVMPNTCSPIRRTPLGTPALRQKKFA